MTHTVHKTKNNHTTMYNADVTKNRGKLMWSESVCSSCLFNGTAHMVHFPIWYKSCLSKGEGFKGLQPSGGEIEMPLFLLNFSGKDSNIIVVLTIKCLD